MNSSAPNSGMDRMDGFSKAFGAVSGVASTAWGYAKQLPSSDINGKASAAVSGVSSAACGYAKQLSNSDIKGKAFGAVSAACGYAKQLPISDINGKAFGAVSGVASAACGYAKQLSNLPTVQQKLNMLGAQTSQIADLQSIKGMCTGLGVILYELVDEDIPMKDRINVKTVGAVAAVGVGALGLCMLAGGLVKIVPFAAWGVYKLVFGLVKIVRFAAWGLYKLVFGLVKILRSAAWSLFKLVGGSGKKMMKNPGRPWELIDAVKFRNNPVFRKVTFDITHMLKKAK